jgi:nitrite reductase/ring-hydroxylating ferredoxin subunit
MPAPGRLRALCGIAAVHRETPVRAELDDICYVVSMVGEYACTHGPAMLADGIVHGDEIECPLHGGRFHIVSGRATAPPCMAPLRISTPHIIDAKICIDPAEPDPNAGT